MGHTVLLRIFQLDLLQCSLALRRKRIILLISKPMSIASRYTIVYLNMSPIGGFNTWPQQRVSTRGSNGLKNLNPYQHNPEPPGFNPTRNQPGTNPGLTQPITVFVIRVFHCTQKQIIYFLWLFSQTTKFLSQVEILNPPGLTRVENSQTEPNPEPTRNQPNPV